jgi:oligopeptide/dipeptide ABC transporter ATP-binding protein
MKETLNLSIVFVTHDLGVVADICDEVVVLYAGEVVEAGRSIDDIFETPLHPYTQSLLGALKREPGEPLITIPGRPPALNAWPTGCRFQPRCTKAFDACSAHPSLRPTVGREVRCHLHSGNQKT